MTRIHVINSQYCKPQIGCGFTFLWVKLKILGFGKDHFLAKTTWFCCHNHSWKLCGGLLKTYPVISQLQMLKCGVEWLSPACQPCNNRSQSKIHCNQVICQPVQKYGSVMCFRYCLLSIFFIILAREDIRV